jgi:hypothetical protein
VCASGRATGSTGGSLAEIASCQLEYAYLAKASGKRVFFELARRPCAPLALVLTFGLQADGVVRGLARANLTETGGMLPTFMNLSSGAPIGSACRPQPGRGRRC